MILIHCFLVLGGAAINGCLMVGELEDPSRRRGHYGSG